MELLFLAMLVVLMAGALASGFPVAFSLPGSAILTIGAAALAGWAFAGDTSAYFAQGGPVQWLTAGVTNFRGIYWEVERDTLIAIPLFVFMGIMLQRSRIAEDLLVTMAQLFGPIPGGLGISVVFVGALLAATTGIVGATVVAMGLISLPAMMRSKYSNALATGTIAASGTLGQIIPPSIVLIILADQLASAADQASTARKALFKESTGQFSMPSGFDTVSTSAGDMFMGAFVPGLVLVAAYMIFILVLALARPKLAPAVHFEGKLDARFALRVLMILVPPLTLIIVVLGSILTGIATVNQAGAIGAVGAMVMAGERLYAGKPRAHVPAALAAGSVLAMIVITQVSPINVKSINGTGDVIALVLAAISVFVFVISLIWSGWRTFKIDNTLQAVMMETAKTSSLVFIILLGAAMLTAAFRAFGGEDLVRDFLTTLPGGFWVQFVIVMGVIFFLGFFLDFIEIAVVVVPIVAPILLADPSANVTAVWLGVMIGLNIQTSFLTPPFGFALFYLRGVAPPSVRTTEMYRGVTVFIALQLLVLAVVAVNPALVNYLPSRVSLTADTAPPPLNPRLQYCMERELFREYESREGEIRKAIERAATLDLSSLPKSVSRDVAAALERSAKTFELVEAIGVAEATTNKAAVEYGPLHAEVRTLQRRARRIAAEIKELQRDVELEGRRETPDVDAISVDEAAIAEFEAERAALLAQIPADWEARHDAFVSLQKAEEKARNTYRKNVDQSFEPIQEVVTLLADTAALSALGPRIESLRQSVATSDPAASVDVIAEVASAVNEVAGTRDIRRALLDARRAVRNKEPDVSKALEEIDKARELHAAELAWRERARGDVLPGLQAYSDVVRENIGLRQQSRLPRDKALEIASCTADHRDISLHF